MTRDRTTTSSATPFSGRAPPHLSPSVVSAWYSIDKGVRCDPRILVIGCVTAISFFLYPWWIVWMLFLSTLLAVFISDRFVVFRSEEYGVYHVTGRTSKCVTRREWTIQGRTEEKKLTDGWEGPSESGTGHGFYFCLRAPPHPRATRRINEMIHGFVPGLGAVRVDDTARKNGDPRNLVLVGETRSDVCRLSAFLGCVCRWGFTSAFPG